jgi:hypothetical protein
VLRNPDPRPPRPLRLPKHARDHCATPRPIRCSRKEWLVRLNAGMPGGIGNTGFERGRAARR